MLSFPLLPPEAFPPHAGAPRVGRDPAARSPAFALPPGRRPHLGDIVISVERAIEQAGAGRGGQTGDVRWSAADELRLLAVHGALHVCGWDHAEPVEEAAMRALERRLLGCGRYAGAPGPGLALEQHAAAARRRVEARPDARRSEAVDDALEHGQVRAAHQVAMVARHAVERAVLQGDGRSVARRLVAGRGQGRRRRTEAIRHGRPRADRVRAARPIPRPVRGRHAIERDPDVVRARPRPRARSRTARPARRRAAPAG